jgi:hypothetical protein
VPVAQTGDPDAVIRASPINRAANASEAWGALEERWSSLRLSSVGVTRYAAILIDLSHNETVSELCHMALQPPLNTVIYEDMSTRIDVA